MTAKRIALALALAAVLATSANFLRAQSSEEPTTAQTSQQGGILDVLEQTRLAQSQQLEGSWTYTVTPVVPPGVPQPPPQRAYVTLARGGALTGYVRNVPGGPHYSPHHGVWEHLRGNEFALAFVRDEFDAQGNLQGTAKISTRLTLTGRDEFVGVGSREFRDAAGNVADIIRCSTIKAERIKIEPLAPQCQGITPPQ